MVHRYAIVSIIRVKQLCLSILGKSPHPHLIVFTIQITSTIRFIAISISTLHTKITHRAAASLKPLLNILINESDRFTGRVMNTRVRVCLIALILGLAAVQAEKVYNLEDELEEIDSLEAAVHQPQYLVINSELVEETESKNPDENLKLVGLMTKDSSWLTHFKRRAAELLLSLPESLNSCDYKSYKRLARNFIASSGRSHEPTGLRRVDAIVYHFAEEHAKKCRPTYAASFKAFRDTVNPQVYEHVTEMFKGLPEADLVKFAKIDYDADVDMLTTGLAAININIKNVLLILEHLENLIEDADDKKLLYAVPDELNGGYIMSPKFQANIYEKYIVAPCKRYTKKSKKVFAPARFDAALEDEAQKELLHPADETFRQAWVNHRLCLYMMRMPPMERISRVIADRIPSK